MLSSLLDTIKSQFAGKSYWLGCMLPLILFLAANVVVARPHYHWLSALVPQADTWDQKSLKYGAALAVLLALAYILSTITGVQLKMLEGSIPPLSGLRWLLCPRHTRKLRELDRAYAKADSDRDFFEKSGPRWLNALERSGKAGQNAPPLSPEEIRRWTAGGVRRLIHRIASRLGREDQSLADLTDTSRLIHRIVSQEDRGSVIDAELIQKAVDALSVILARRRSGATGILAEAITTLQSAIQYGMDRNKFDQLRLLKLRQTNFPGYRPDSPDPPEGGIDLEVLAPTAMGNIGRTMGTYSLGRYGMDLDIFWTRLLCSLQKDSKEYFAVLQDSKVQVDSMVMMFWMSLVFTVFWAAALVFWFDDSTVPEFLTVTLSGTAAAVIFYLLACEAYRVFADVMRASVDLMRFQVLQSLHIALPTGIDEEKYLWYVLGGATGFLDPISLQYKHPS
ncbi:MAG TPA: hypothetical protein VNH18_01435 [Bryobacteraceae bacterium]|nr:hypothetical protein [Bryobacteraceae bacterium]